MQQFKHVYMLHVLCIFAIMYIDVCCHFWSVMVLLGTGEQFSHYGWTIGDIFNNAAIETNEIVQITSI